MAYLFSLLLISAPLYVWRFSIGGLPTNFLMVINFVVLAVGLLVVLRQHEFNQLKQNFISLGKPLLVCISLFGLASFISLVAFGVSATKLAQWVVLYAQPLSFFILVRYFARKDERVVRYFKIACYIFVAVAGALALIQYFTLTTLPEMWWGNANEPKRAISFFAHANAYGLFVTPLLAWLIPDVVQRVRGISPFALTANSFKKESLRIYHKYLFALAWLVGVIGVFLSLSRGAWLGLIVATGAYVLISANKKLIITFAVAGLVLAGIIVATPNLRYRVLLPFHGEKSAIARLSLWDTGSAMIKGNFILGKGIDGFNENWDKYNKDPNLDHYNFPHNIVLNFWVDLGLLGMLSMMAILALVATKGFVNRANPAAFGVLLVILAIVAHGLIDIPYLKNDLALVFWLILAVSL